jgi:hypothetical protein
MKRCLSAAVLVVPLVLIVLAIARDCISVDAHLRPLGPQPCPRCGSPMGLNVHGQPECFRCVFDRHAPLGHEADTSSHVCPANHCALGLLPHAVSPPRQSASVVKSTHCASAGSSVSQQHAP